MISFWIIKRIWIFALLIALSLFISGGAAFADPPHDVATCNGCHLLHNATGTSLTKATNENLCISCHMDGGSASNKPFSASMQPGGAFKTSHSWTGTMPNAATDLGPNNPYGLRTDSQVTDAGLLTNLGKFGTCTNPTYVKKSSCESNGGTWTAQVVCSTCHDVHSQLKTMWNPFGTNTFGAASGGSTTYIDDITQNWTENWKSSQVRITSGANNGRSPIILSNQPTRLNITTLSQPIAPGNTYIVRVGGRKMMRSSNDLNQMCENCHYYMTPNAPGNRTDVKTWDGNKKSHPIVKNLTTDVTDSAGFVGAAPVDANCTAGTCPAQTGAPRYHLNGAGDTNSTNNIVFDSNGKIRCLSCHGMHYTDSNSSTVDQP